MPVFRVPIVVDDQEQIYRPTTAEKGKAYYCFICHEPVVFKKGEVKAAHFAHKVTDTCNPETIIHKTAKLLVQRAVHEWKSGETVSPTLQRKCQICWHLTDQPLPDKVEKAILEYPLEDGSIADVALMVNGVAGAAIEIRVTHAVDDAKAEKLRVPFIELEGNEVVANPTVWRPITDTFKPITCEKCKSSYVKFQTRASEFAKANNLSLPTSYYRYGLCECWTCKREIIVYLWPKQGSHYSAVPKIKPVPRVIQYRYIKGLGRCWVNTCLFCQSIQGDMYLHVYGHGPFSPVHCDDEDDSPAAFHTDMMKIASFAVEEGILYGK